MSKSVKVRLDSRTGQILEQLNEGIDTENAFITGTRIITVPQNVLDHLVEVTILIMTLILEQSKKS